MKKEGQVTIFVIIGVVIIVAVVLFFLLRSSGESSEVSINPDAGGIDSLVYSCIEKVGKEAIFNISLGGGYYNIPELSVKSKVPIYYSDGRSSVPSKEVVEVELSKYINDNLENCVGDFSEFSGYNVRSGVASASSLIKENITFIEVSYPLYISRGGVAVELDDFSRVGVDSRLGANLMAVSGFIKEQVGNDGLCLSCLVDNLVAYDLHSDMFDYGNSTIFIINPSNSSLDKENLDFVFAVQFGWEIEE